jgi:uroporphyrinogen-III synthase
MRPRNNREIELFMERLNAGEADVVVITSQNGLGFILEKVIDRAVFVRKMNGLKVLAIGPKTKKALDECGIRAAAMPSEFSSEGIVREFSFPRQNVEVLRSDQGNPVLLEGLRKGGAHVTETIVYDIVPLSGEAQKWFVREAVSGKIDAYTFTSTMTAKSLLMMAEAMGMLPELKMAVNAKKVAVIGNPTAAFLKKNGIRVDVVPVRFTFEDMIDALAKVL